MEIHQVVVAAAAGDAVTNTAFEYQRLLRRIGPSDVYATHRDPAVAHDVLPLSTYAARASAREGRNVLVVHMSIGDVGVGRFLADRPERLVLVYHNVTPAEFFEPYDHAFARLLRQGRHEVLRLADRVDVAIAVSQYNAAELRELGYCNVRVCPIVVDFEALGAVAPDPVLAATLSEPGAPTYLYVGQILPHKRPDLLLDAHHVLVSRLLPEARLVLAGHARNRAYTRVFKEQLAELNLPGVAFLGGVTEQELVACFHAATAFVTASEHEGVCIPLLEAMAFDRPVIARDFGAVSETLEGAGLLLPPDSGALMVAEAMAELAEPSPLRTDLVERGRRRLEAFDPDAARAAFLQVVLEVAR